MKTILQGWNLMRIFRLILGIIIVVHGAVAKDATTIIIGLVFGGMAGANIGCTGTNGCAINTTSTSKKKRIHYEGPAKEI